MMADDAAGATKEHAPPTAPISVAAGVGTAHGHDTEAYINVLQKPQKAVLTEKAFFWFRFLFIS